MSVTSLMTKTYRYLSNIATGIVGRKIVAMNVMTKDALGYTSAGNRIHVAYEHPIYSGLSEAQTQTVRTGVAVHEALHQVFTNFRHMTNETERLRRIGYFTCEYDEYIYHQLANLIEDPAIESMAPEVVGGIPLKALRYSIKVIDKNSDYDAPKANAMEELTAALIQFGDVGIVRDNWEYPKARKCFLDIAGNFYEAINEPDGKKRIDMVLPILEKVRAIYPEMKERKVPKNGDGSERSLSRSSTPTGKGSGKKGSGADDDSEINKKRKITVKKVKRDEWERMKKEAEGSESSEDPGGDITVYVPEDGKPEEEKEGEKASSVSVPTPSGSGEKTSEKEDSDSSEASDVSESEESTAETKETSESTETSEESEGSEDSEETKGSEDTKGSEEPDGEEEPDDSKEVAEESEESESSEDEPESSTSDTEDEREKSTKDSSPDMTEEGFAEDENTEGANPFELTEEEAEELTNEEVELTDEELRAIVDFAESMSGEEGEDTPPEGLSEHEKPAYDYGDVISKELHTTAKCVNNIPHATDREIDAYESVKQPYEADISMLQEELREIFHDDSTKSYYARSGRVNLKRMISGSCTTRLFERKERSTQKESIAVYILVDMSGSTGGEKIEQERLAAILTSEALSDFNIPVYVTGFTECFNNAGTVEHFHYVRWDNTIEERASLLKIQAGGNNFDAYAIRYAEEMLKTRSEKRKLMIVISDGLPASKHSGGQAGMQLNATTVAHAKEQGIKVLCFGVGDVSKEAFEYMYGKGSFIDVSNPAMLFNELSTVLRNVIDGTDEDL